MQDRENPKWQTTPICFIKSKPISEILCKMVVVVEEEEVGGGGGGLSHKRQPSYLKRVAIFLQIKFNMKSTNGHILSWNPM